MNENTTKTAKASNSLDFLSKGQKRQHKKQQENQGCKSITLPARSTMYV